jgi:hypothetical protein
MRLLARFIVVAVLLFPLAVEAQGRRRAVSFGPPASSTCTVSGLPGFFLSADRGQTFSRNRADVATPGAWDIAVFPDEPQSLITVVRRVVLDSADGGCNWTERYTITDEIKHPIHVVPASGRRAFIWAEEFVYRYDDGSVVKLTPPEPPGALGVNTGNREHVRLLGLVTGKAWESLDGGQTWRAVGGSAGGVINSAAFDPADVNHILAAVQTQGIRRSRDGGRNWSAAATASRTVCRMAFVPGRSNVVWMTVTALAGQNSVYRSTDAGQRFDAIGSITGVENSVCLPLVVNPHNPDVALILFGSIRAYDAITKGVTTASCCNGFVERAVYSPDNPEAMFVFASTR